MGDRNQYFSKYHKGKYAECRKKGVCHRHPDVMSENGTALCLKCLEQQNKIKKRAYKKKISEGKCPSHSNKLIVLGKSKCQYCYDQDFKKRKEQREQAIQMIFEAHRVYECHRNIHPFMPEDLKSHQCWGRLWIEHPYGKSSKDEEDINGKLPRALLAGRKDPKNYLVLCRLHQIWNNNH